MGYLWGDQYKDEYIDDGREEGEEPAPETSFAKYFREKEEFLESLKDRNPGRCSHCNCRMRVLNANLQKKRRRVGSICPICYNIESWLGGLIHD